MADEQLKQDIKKVLDYLWHDEKTIDEPQRHWYDSLLPKTYYPLLN